jgi:hypothetical protein
MMPLLDIRHISIIDALPVYDTDKEVLTVGCGDCKIDYYLLKMGYKVYSTDYQTAEKFKKNMEEYFFTLNYYHSNIFNLNSFPIQNAESVICSEVLEHLINYKEAFMNLLILARKRLIITVPFEQSYNDSAPPPEGHCNFWSNSMAIGYNDIHEFIEMAKPHAISIQKIRTKELDIQMRQYDYLIIVDKKQKYNT